MGVLRRVPAQPVVEQQVFRRRRNPLLAADDVADLHQVIVDDDREMIGGEPVRLQQHLVVEARQVERDLPAQRVGDRYRSLARGFMRITCAVPASIRFRAASVDCSRSASYGAGSPEFLRFRQAASSSGVVKE